MKTVRKFMQLPAERRLLLAEACLYLVNARIQTSTLPFQRITRTLDTALADPPRPLSPAQQSVVSDLASAVQQAARHLPIKLLCLQQAIAAKRMLARRGIPGTLYLGTQRDQEGQLSAHAWLSSGTTSVTGGSGKMHTILSRIT